MQNIHFCVITIMLLLTSSCSNALKKQDETDQVFIDYVDPLIGTDGKGKTYPGAALPFGMIQLSPDNGRNGWDWISGYFYPDSVIAGFSHLHLSGTGAGDLYDISFLPVSGELKEAKLDNINNQPTVYSKFSHDKEIASPGYYNVFLDDYNVDVELTVTERTGLQRYTFNNDDNHVRLHLGYTRNWDNITESYIKIVNDSTIIGCRNSTGWARDQKVYFASVFSAPFEYELYDNKKKVTGDSLNSLNILSNFYFDTKEVMVKTAISSVNTQNALLNLRTEQTGFDFDKVKRNAQNRWEAQLSKVQIEASVDNIKQFYTAMYHTMLAPTLYSDVNGEYKGTDGNIWHTQGGGRYSTYSLWDTYRALHPWLTITAPHKVETLMSSMLEFQNESGLLPVWNMQGGETNMMIGYHAAPVLTDAILKGIKVDTLTAYQAMKSSAMQDDRDVNDYRELGYVPFENRGWSVSITMEYAYDDWCIAQVAKILGEEEDYAYFMKRSNNYLNHFDDKTKFFRAKSKKGELKTPFNPLAYHPEDYCEANAWQYYWYVPHDVSNLISLSGGNEQFEEKLDDLFTTNQAAGEDPDWISGYIGQYVHGNEPSHHVPYLYQYVGQSNKTQAMVRRIMNELYTTQPDGLAGNEDCGQMSAWYLFSSLGFYPVNPADGRYVIGSPEVYNATLQLDNGKQFKITTKNQSPENVYVSSVKLNGDLLQEYYITHAQLLQGGELEFEMSSTPNKKG